MIDFCSHTNSTLLQDCLMSNESPYKIIIIVLGLISMCIYFYLVGNYYRAVRERNQQS